MHGSLAINSDSATKNNNPTAFTLRKFYELKGKTLLLLNQPYEAYSALKDALYICRKEILANRLSILFFIIVGVLIIWYSVLLPILEKLF